jgi:hypothetical protein
LSDIRAAVQSAEDAEAWAVGTIGGVPVSTSAEQHENNSKYYAELAESIASDMSSIEVTTMPTASAELANKVRIYIGQTTSTYTSGQSYQCIEDPENAGVYIWEPTASKVTVDNVTIQENASGQLETVVKIWNGSSADWKVLSLAEKSKWNIVNITDDADDTSTIETQIQALTNSVNTNTDNITTNTNEIQALASVTDKRTLLWTNPNNYFYATDLLELPLSGYDAIDIEFTFTENTFYWYTQRFDNTPNSSGYISIFFINPATASDVLHSLNACSRAFTILSNGIKWGIGTQIYNNAYYGDGTGFVSTRAVPRNIYGIKY